jgi:hypothetical protein
VRSDSSQLRIETTNLIFGTIVSANECKPAMSRDMPSKKTPPEKAGFADHIASLARIVIRVTP